MTNKNLIINQFFISILCVFCFSCQEDKVAKLNNTAFIPTDAGMIIKLNDFSSWQNKIESQKFILNQKDNHLLSFGL